MSMTYFSSSEAVSVNKTILIIGHPKSGKTTFFAQFFTRVRKRKSCITLYKAPVSIKAITNAEKRLAAGEEPSTTSADENVELVLPIAVKGQNFDLVCPDYGGEQVNNLTDLMEVDSNWHKLVNSSNRWLLFIRPHHITPEYDLSVSSYDYIEKTKSDVIEIPVLSTQSKFIELIQTLLYVKSKRTKQPILEPKLSVVLTCWDELITEKTPYQVLEEKLPLLLHYIETIWIGDSVKIFGLSAQEFPLITQEAKDKYQDELPENFGYIINPEGKKDNDITKLVEMALQ